MKLQVMLHLHSPSEAKLRRNKPLPRGPQPHPGGSRQLSSHRPASKEPPHSRIRLCGARRVVVLHLHKEVTAETETVHRAMVAISLTIDKPNPRGRRDIHASIQQVWSPGKTICLEKK